VTSSPAEPALELRAAAAERSGRRVLGPIDLRVERGDALLLAGPNGSGKTTLLLLLVGLIRASSGSVRVLGTSLGSAEWRRARRKVGYVNQASVDTTLPISALEVAAIGLAGAMVPPQLRRERLRRAMQSAGCLHLEHRLYRELSGGEKQRVDIARCLAQEPELLLLDEPSAALDPSAKEALGALLGALHDGGLTIVAVSHETGSLPSWPVASLSRGLLEPARLG